MIDRELAEELFSTCRRYGAELNQALAKVQDQCSREDFEWCRTAVARIMASAQDNLMEPLIKQHPALEPESWKDEGE